MPVKVIDRATQQEIDVSAEDAQYGITNGTLMLPAGSVVVANGRGEIGDVDPAQLMDALGQGWRMVDEEEARGLQLAKEESTVGAQALGLAESAAAGATLGLSTLAEERLLGEGARRHMQARREGLGAAGTAAEVGGALLPMLFTGGGSAAVQGGAKAGAAARGLGALDAVPAGLLGRGGSAIERGLGTALEGAPGLVRSTVPLAGRGAVEGFAMQVGANLDDAVLESDRELTAERLLQGAPMAAFLGGAAGSVIPGLAYAGSGLGRIATKPMQQVLGKASGFVDELGDKGLASLLASPTVRKTVSGAGSVPLHEVDEVFDFIGKDAAYANRVYTEGPRVTEEIADGVRPAIEGWQSARKFSVTEGSGLARRAAVERHLPRDHNSLTRVLEKTNGKLSEIEALATHTLQAIERGEISVSPTAMRAVLADVREARLGLLRDADSTLPTNVSRRNPGVDVTSKRAFFPRKQKTAIQEEIEGMFGPVQENTLRPFGAATRESDDIAGKARRFEGHHDLRSVAASAVMETDRLKQHIDALAAAQRKIAHSTEAGGPTADVLSTMGGTLRSHLEDGAVHGEALGRMVAERNNLMHLAITQRNATRGTAGGRLLDGERAIDNADLLTLVRDSATFRGGTRTEKFLDAVEAENNYARWILEHGEISDAERAVLKEQIEASSKISDAFEAQRAKVRTVETLNRWKTIESNASVSTGIFTSPMTTLLGLGGYALGGLPGAILGGALGQLTRPHALARKLAAIQARLNGAERESMKAIAGTLKRLGKGAGAAAGAIGSGIGTATRRLSSQAGVNREQRLDQVRQQTQMLAANPGLLAGEVAKMTIDLDEDAPKLSQAVGLKAQQAATYLASVAPKGYVPPMSKRPPMYAPEDLERYARRVEAVMDPRRTIARIFEGTLTRDHVEALKAVWPAEYDWAQRQVFEAVAAYEGDLPLDLATQLSTLFEAPVDPTLPLAGGIQIAFAQGAQQAQAMQQGSRKPNLPQAELDTARYDSPMDAATKASHA